MSVRAKFRVSMIEDYGFNKKLKLSVVYENAAGEDKENIRFTKATPSGELWMTVDNPAATDQFRVGQEWYVDFTLAKDVAAD